MSADTPTTPATPATPSPSGLKEWPVTATRPSGVVLHGTAVQAAGSDSKYAVLMCHGLLSHKDHNFAPQLANAIAKVIPHAVFRFDFRFEKQAAEPDFRYRFSGFRDDLDDMDVLLAQLRTDGYTPWCLFGHSRGANDVILYAASRLRDFEVPRAGDGKREREGMGEGEGKGKGTGEGGETAHQLTVVAIAARFTMPNMVSRLFTPEIIEEVESKGVGVWSTKKGELDVTLEDFREVRERINMDAAIRAIPSDVPVLIMHGADDEVISVSDARLFVDARPETKLIEVEGARHALAGKKPTRLLTQTVCDFLTQQVKSLPVG